MAFSLARRWLYIFILLVLVIANVTIGWLLLFSPSHARELRVSFLNIGQGDSIFIEGPTGLKMLVDGGPDRSVLRELSKQLWPWDRHMDVLVETHPDKDHIEGLGDVLERYDVSNFLESGVPDQTNVSRHVKDDVAKEKGLLHTIVKRGERLHLGGGAYADILFPDTDQSQQKDTNSGSVSLHVVYGTTSFMLTGDLPSTYEDHLVQISRGTHDLKSDVLKAGHHGSRFSTDSIWLNAVAPKTVVISAGKGNTYGHPAHDTIDRINRYGANIVSTIDSGTITFSSDGMNVVRK